MAISLKHAFTSLKGDGSDSTLIRPSNWNAEHTLTLAQDKIIGRSSSGTGAAEEITCTAAARSILDDATVADILATLGISPPTTGDLRLTLKTTATTGWVMFNDGTIGDATSGASRANADTQALFTLIFDNILDANAPILTSAGAATTRAAQTNAATAWAANCRISLPKALGRALAVAGSGSGLTARALGVNAGAETVTLTTSEMPSHYHGASIYDPGHAHGMSVIAYNSSSSTGGGAFSIPAVSLLSSTNNATTGVRVNSANGLDTTASAGTGGAHANVQPSVFLNVMVKL
jgi:microcystin-dependent protein